MEEGNTTDFTSYILLCVSGLLVFIDGLELMHIISNWQTDSLFILPVFEKCIKYELITKTIFALFSLISALSAFHLSFFLLFWQSFFLEKFLDTFLFVNYIFFGPLLLSVSLLGVHFWDDVGYVCEKNDLKIKEISASNTMTIFGCFLISVILTLLVEFFNSLNFVLDSIMKRNSGSPIIGKFFWKVVSFRTERDRIRSYNRGGNVNTNALNNNNNFENNNDNNNQEHNNDDIEASNHNNNLIGICVSDNISNGNNINYRQVNNNCDLISNNHTNIIIVNEDNERRRDEIIK